MTYAKTTTHSFRLGREGMGGAFDGCGATIKRYYLLIRDSVSCPAGGALLELQSKALPTRVNCREGSGAIWRGGSTIGVLGVSIGLPRQGGGSGGPGLFAWQNFDLNRRTAAIPFPPVIAGLD